jgi:hypothetical protein
MAEGNLILEVRVADIEQVKQLIEAVRNIGEMGSDGVFCTCGESRSCAAGAEEAEGGRHERWCLALDRALAAFGKKEPLPDFEELKRQATAQIVGTDTQYRRDYRWQGAGEFARVSFELCGELMADIKTGVCPFEVEWLLPDFKNRCWYVRKMK